MTNSKEYDEGKIPAMVEYIVWLVEKKHGVTGPEFSKVNMDKIWFNIKSNFPELKDKTKCANCGASMAVREGTAGIHVAILLLRMGEQVAQNLKRGMTFTDANRVHIPDLPCSDAIRHIVTWASYLDLVWQPDKWRNSGYWLVTNWGWKALSGQPVPMSVKQFRGKIKSRSENTITLAEMFRVHKEKVETAIARRQAVKNDFRADVSSYNPIEWAEIAGYAEGNML